MMDCAVRGSHFLGIVEAEQIAIPESSGIPFTRVCLRAFAWIATLGARHVDFKNKVNGCSRALHLAFPRGAVETFNGNPAENGRAVYLDF